MTWGASAWGDKPLGWVPSAAVSVTTVITDAAAAYAVRNSATADAAASYQITSAVQQDASAQYAIRAAVTADASASYSLIAASSVTADASASYVVQGAVQQDASASYAVRAAVFADAVASYALITDGQVTADASASYQIRGAVQSDASLAYYLGDEPPVVASSNYGFEMSAGKRYYIKRKGKILLFNSAEQADEYLETEQQATVVKSRGAKKRIAAKLVKVAPIETIELEPVTELLSRYMPDVSLPNLLKMRDIDQVLKMQHQALQMQDDEDIELLLMTL